MVGLEPETWPGAWAVGVRAGGSVVSQHTSVGGWPPLPWALLGTASPQKGWFV